MLNTEHVPLLLYPDARGKVTNHVILQAGLLTGSTMRVTGRSQRSSVPNEPGSHRVIFTLTGKPVDYQRFRAVLNDVCSSYIDPQLATAESHAENLRMQASRQARHMTRLFCLDAYFT